MVEEGSLGLVGTYSLLLWYPKTLSDDIDASTEVSTFEGDGAFAESGS